MFWKKKKFFITTSIPYTNAPPHVGFALEAIQADVVARYHRSLNHDVFFLTGTDEHGLKTKKAAQEAGISLDEFLNQTSGKFRGLRETLNLSWEPDHGFIRTTDASRHIPAVQHVWRTLLQNDDLYKRKYKGFYCAGCEAFKTDKELKDSQCIIHQKPVDIVEEENYFFKISKYINQIRQIIENNELQIIPEVRKNEVLNMIENGLDDVSFSRAKEKYDGIPVPNDSEQIIYVWADALPNYISALGYPATKDPGLKGKFKKYWPADVHCIGKDIIKFHAVYWPAILLSLGLEIPKALFVHGFVTANGQKMSKSLGNVVDPFELVKKYGTDAVRYYLLREFTPTEDGDFTYEKFEQRYNGDLAGGIGNLAARTLALANKPNFKEVSPTSKIKKEMERVSQEWQKFLEEFKFNESLKSIWDGISFCDKYINEEKPWEGKESASRVISDILFALDGMADLLLPFMPETAEKIKKGLQAKKSEILFPRLGSGA